MINPNGNADVSARAFHSADQAITSGVIQALALDSERWDTNAFHDLIANNSRLTILIAGTYIVWGGVSFAPSGAGTYRRLLIRMNGVGGAAIGQAQIAPVAGGPATQMVISTVYKFVAGDYVELCVGHDVGSNINVAASPNISPELSIALIT